MFDEAPKAEFLGLPLVRVNTPEFIEEVVQICGRSTVQAPALITYLNAWCTVIADKDPEYRNLLLKADALYADGQAIVWASNFLGHPVPERVNAADFIVPFCRRAAEAGVSIYLIGSAPGVAAAAAGEWQRQVPGSYPVGTESGYFADGGEAAIKRVYDARPDILLVGLGVPLQEKWVSANLHRLPVKVVWCIGAMFEYHGLARARAPEWMRRAGLEWLFRLVLEPGRLARRYLIGNLQFLWKVLRARIATRIQ